MITRIERIAVAACGAIAVGAALAALAAAPARAQEGGAPVPPPPDSSAVPAPAETAPAPPAPSVLPTPAALGDTSWLALPALAEVRSAAAIAADKKMVETQRVAASQRMAAAREAEVRWRSRVDVQKGAIDALKKQADVAKKEKREADAKSIESQKRTEETKRTYYERLRDMYVAEGEFQKAVIDFFDARRVGLEAEGQLEARAAAVGGARTVESMEAELRAIELSRERASRMSAMADKERALGDRRKSVYDAWKKLGT